MRSALALSALLLLLLLLSPPSLAQDNGVQPSEPLNDKAITAKQDPGMADTTTAADVEDKANLNKTAEPSHQLSTGADAGASEAPTTGSLVPTPAPSKNTSTKAPTDSGTTAAPTQASSPPDSLSMEKASTTSSPTDPSTSPQAKISTSVPTKPDTTSVLDGAQSLKTSSAPRTGEPTTSPPMGVNSTTPVLSTSTSPAPMGSVTPSSTSTDQRTVASGGSTPTAGPTSVPSGSPFTLSTVPSDTSPSHVLSSSLKPSVTETLTLSTGSPTPDTTRPTDTASSPEPVPSTGAPADWSASFTSAAPHDVHPSPTSTAGSYTVHCEPPERFSEKLLVLNFTKPRPCVESHFDDKLRTILCQTAKSTFNSAHDQCHIWLAPVPEIQALAVKKIVIETNLLPQDMYELMKDKWDALKEVGVSNMQLEGQGPPEEAEDRFSMPLIITIICMASFLLLVAALYGCCHQRLSQRKDQQRLTEELQTVENGYHDNPTLEVMETSAEMQEKKVVSLNGELGDSWIVPLDNLTKDDLDEEEDTHL